MSFKFSKENEMQKNRNLFYLFHLISLTVQVKYETCKKYTAN